MGNILNIICYKLFLIHERNRALKKKKKTTVFFKSRKLRNLKVEIYHEISSYLKGYRIWWGEV